MRGWMLLCCACGTSMAPSDGGGSDARVDRDAFRAMVDAAPPGDAYRDLPCEIGPGMCDEFLDSDNGVINRDFMGEDHAGETLCIRRDLVLIYARNLRGAEGNPVTITNCGGRRAIDNTANRALAFHNFQHVRITGTGSRADAYGLWVNAGTSLAIDLDA